MPVLPCHFLDLATKLPERHFALSQALSLRGRYDVCGMATRTTAARGLGLLLREILLGGAGVVAASGILIISC